jgi:hypothetical protein
VAILHTKISEKYVKMFVGCMEKSIYGLSNVDFIIQGEQKVSVHLMITIQKVTSNVQRVPRQSPDIY